MDKLLRGVRHFRENVFNHRRNEYLRVAKSQSPLALFITCSDSRVDPELLTSSGPGDIFVLRNAGNLIPPYSRASNGEAATIEYAIAGLGVPHVVVCGHVGCGAMRALLEPNLLTDLPMTESWLSHAHSTRAIAERCCADDAAFDDRWQSLVEINVVSQLEHLGTHPTVAAGLASGSIELHGWIFDFHQGQVSGYDSIAGRFIPLNGESPTQYRPRWRMPMQQSTQVERREAV